MKTSDHFEVESNCNADSLSLSGEMKLCGDLSKAAEIISRLGCSSKVDGKSIQLIMAQSCGAIRHLVKEIKLLSHAHSSLNRDNAKMRADLIAKDNRIKDLVSQLEDATKQLAEKSK